MAIGHRADFERERDRVEQLMAELLKATADTMAAKEAKARLEGELAALRSTASWRWSLSALLRGTSRPSVRMNRAAQPAG